MKLNQYLWNGELEARRRYNAHQAARMNMDRTPSHQAYQSRLQNNPTKDDIDSGAALNVDPPPVDRTPKVVGGSGSSLRHGSTARSPRPRWSSEIPFIDETDAITISLDDLTDPASWPIALRSDALRPEREAYQKAVDEALAEDKEGGTLKPETVARVRTAVAALGRKVEATIPKTAKPDYSQATNYIKGLAGLSRMLERPNVEAVIQQLEKLENTTLGNLVAFMHTYNLRFAPATTPKQSAVYRELYPMMVAQRDKVLGKPTESSGEPTPPPAVENPTAMFHGIDTSHLYPKPPAPQPGTAPPPAKP